MYQRGLLHLVARYGLTETVDHSYSYRHAEPICADFAIVVFAPVAMFGGSMVAATLQLHAGKIRRTTTRSSLTKE